VKGKKSEQKMG